MFAYFRPLAADFTVQFEHFPIFFLTPFFLLYLWIQFVDESFANLLAIFGSQHLGKKFPVFTILLDKFPDGVVFLRRPDLVTFAQLGESSVAMETLVVIAIDHLGCDFPPFLWKSLIEFEQLVILLAAPGLDLAFGDFQVLLPHLHVDLPAVLGQERNHKLSLHFFYKPLIYISHRQKRQTKNEDLNDRDKARQVFRGFVALNTVGNWRKDDVVIRISRSVNRKASRNDIVNRIYIKLLTPKPPQQRPSFSFPSNLSSLLVHLEKPQQSQPIISTLHSARQSGG